MRDAAAHYEDFLAEHYTWMCGGLEPNVQRATELLAGLDLRPKGGRLAVDLGAGSGFFSFAMERSGYEVVSIDLSNKLLNELRERSGGLKIQAVTADLLDFAGYIDRPAELIACTGDTLTHLGSLADVERLLGGAAGNLESRGSLLISYRDLAAELADLDRFIPVRSERDRIFTCALEYRSDHVLVTDLVHLFEDGEWTLYKSCYRKLRIPLRWLTEKLSENGFEVKSSRIERGMTTLLAAWSAAGSDS